MQDVRAARAGDRSLARAFTCPRPTLRSGPLGLLVLAACSGGGASLPDELPVPDSTFAVESVNVLDGITWQLNRGIEVTFTADVDFSTISASTVQIVDAQGGPAVGSYSLVSPRTVRFQPACPTDDAFSDGGLGQGRRYRLVVPSESDPGIGGGVTVQDTAGQRLRNGSNLSFFTPESSDERVLFVDTTPGPPRVRVRGLDGETLDSVLASYVEYPSRQAPQDRDYLVFDPATQLGVASGVVPLNLYSDEDTRFAFVLRFDQPVISSSSNVNASRIGLEYLEASTSTWERVPSTVELLSNCTGEGAAVRVAPAGIVPQGSQLRAVVREGFRDLTGDPVPATLANFARVTTDVADPGGASPDDGVDGILVDFDVPGGVAGSLEDTATPSVNPRARWSGGDAPGVLEASFDFAGTGGPGGDFDWIVGANQNVIISTDADSILGGPGGFPTNQQAIIGGVINVRNLVVEQGARVTFVGSNTVTILATETVDISGTLSVNGGDHPGVGTLNTTNIPELGANGNAGGGDGGIGSQRTSQSTARGGRGFGAFNVPGGGGEGGETGYGPGGQCGKERRRGGGGGGGRLGADVRYEVGGGFFLCQTLIGFDVERGGLGSLDGLGAQSQSAPAAGGAPGPRPFIDSSDENDFLGTLLTADGRQVRGELSRVWAGAGGGGGGDASTGTTFPVTPFSIMSDEKGCGGGGGAGGLEILSVGDVIVRPTGRITADGGTGNGGENLSFFDRVGGASGGGSGGHIVISSAGRIMIEAEATADTVGDFYLDDASPVTTVHEKRPITALGGQGGAGRQDICGASRNGESEWARDSIPTENFEGSELVPPRTLDAWRENCNRTAPCATGFPIGEMPGAGGDGGPGIIQLHVADPATQLLFPNRPGVYGDLANPVDPTRSCSPPPFGWTRPGEPVDTFIPFFSARSEAFTQWIPLGLARANPGGAADEQVLLQFGGTDPATGDVLRDGSLAQELPPLVAYTALSSGGALPSVDGAAATFRLARTALPELYAVNPALLVQFAVRVRQAGVPASESEYLVQSARLDEATDAFEVVVDPRGTALSDQLLGLAAPEVELVPFFFRLSAAGQRDAFPPGTEIRVLFDAARANRTTGAPSTDPSELFSGGDVAAFTPDITDLNGDVWDYVRVKFEFLIDIDDRDAPRPGIDWVRVLYSF